MKFSLLTFISDQLSAPPNIPHSTYHSSPTHPVNLADKTVFVLGANTGLGYEAAVHFARMRPGRLVLGCRDAGRGGEALERIRNLGIKDLDPSSLSLRLVDLQSFTSVQSFSKKFNEEEERLDVLVANAGIATDVFRATEDGWESTVQTNHLSTALLTLLLLPKMVHTYQAYYSTSANADTSKETFKPRILIVSSEVHYFTTFPKELTSSKDGLIETLGGEVYSKRKGVMGTRYFDSKLLNVFFTRAFASHLSSTSDDSRTLPVTITTVNPGFCRSSIRHSIHNPIARFFNSIIELTLLRETEPGARGIVWAGVDWPESKSGCHFAENKQRKGKGLNVGGKGKGVDAMHGAYVNNFRVDEVSGYVLGNVGVQEAIWDETVRILTKVEPEVGEIVRKYCAGRVTAEA